MKAHPLPGHLRPRLKEPLGVLIPQGRVDRETLGAALEESGLVVTVGDAATETLLKTGFTPQIQVIDQREKRRPRPAPGQEPRRVVRVRNPAGHITTEALEALKAALAGPKPVRIMVEGEEDLLALVPLATYPKGTRVVYGQPDRGLVICEVGGEASTLAREILRLMGLEV